MISKFRVSLGMFLVACVVVGSVAGIGLRWRWQTRIQSAYDGTGKSGRTAYSVRWKWECPAFERPRLLSCVIIPSFSDNDNVGTVRSSSYDRDGLPDTSDLEILPSGVFYRQQLIGGYGDSRVVIALSSSDVRVIPLSSEDLQALDAAVGFTLLQSQTWKKKVEPQIDQLVAARLNTHDRAALGYVR